MKKDVIVLGAGISGLSLSWFLKKRYGNYLNVKIIEKSSRVGGWIQTLQRGDFLFELGPRSCRPCGQGLEILKLIEELQLENEVIPADASSQKRYLYHDGRLSALPNGLFSLLTSPYLKPIAMALWHDWFTPKGDAQDESVANFINRRLGARIAEDLIDPMMSGIYAGDIRELSIRTCMPDLLAWEQAHGGIVKGMFFRKRPPKAIQTPFIENISKHPIFTLKKGMETLPTALAKRLDGEIMLESEASALTMEGSKAMIRLANGHVYAADHIFSTLPAVPLSQLVLAAAPECAAILQTITSASVAVLNLGYKSKVLQAKGFGYLIPSKAKEEILGIVWDSSIFPQQQKPDTTCMTVMLGGIHYPQIHNLTENELLQKSLNTVAKHLGITTKPDATHITKSCHAIPQPSVGHDEKLKKLQHLLSKHLPCLTIHGSYLGVSVNACIANAKKIVDNCIL